MPDDNLYFFVCIRVMIIKEKGGKKEKERKNDALNVPVNHMLSTKTFL